MRYYIASILFIIVSILLSSSSITNNEVNKVNNEVKNELNNELNNDIEFNNYLSSYSISLNDSSIKLYNNNIYRSILSKKKYISPTVLLNINKKDILTTESTSNGTCYYNLKEDIFEKCKEQKYCNINIVKLIYCLIKLNDTDNVKIKKFISYLPDNYNNHLINYNNIERLLPYFNYYSIINHYETELITQHMYEELFSNITNKETINYYWRSVMSRTFGINNSNEMVMIPIIDLINHKYDAIELQEFDDSFGAMVKSVEVNGEIFIKYFDQSKVPLLTVLSYYGFIPSDGPAALKLRTQRNGRAIATIERYENYLNARVEIDPSTASKHTAALLRLLEHFGCQSDDGYVVNDISLPTYYFVCEYLLSLQPAGYFELLNDINPPYSQVKERLILRSFVKNLKTILSENFISTAEFHLATVDSWINVLTNFTEWNKFQDAPIPPNMTRLEYTLKELISIQAFEFSLKYPIKYNKMVEDRLEAGISVETVLLMDSYKDINLDNLPLDNGLMYYIQRMKIVSHNHPIPIISQCSWYFDSLLAELVLNNKANCGDDVICLNNFPATISQMNSLLNIRSILKLQIKYNNILNYQIDKANSLLDDESITIILPELEKLLSESFRKLKIPVKREILAI